MSSTPSTDAPDVSPSDAVDPRVVSWPEKISYGLGDTACNLVFHMVGTYLLFFYTDVVGLPAAAVGVLFLVTRVIDLISGVAIGIAIDKTNTRWGKCRPYFLWLALPYSVLAVLTFHVPALSAHWKLVYAYLTYNAVSIVYTGINIPLSAMLPSMTRNGQERSEVNSARMFFAFIGVTLVTYGTMPLVHFFGGGDQSKGFLWTMTLFAVFAFSFFVLTFTNTRERYQPKKEAEPTIKDSVRCMMSNWPWAITLVMNFLYWIGFAMRTQTAVYYLRYNFHRPDLIPAVMLTNMASLPFIVLGAIVTRRLGKRNTMLIGTVLMALGTGLIAFTPSTAPSLFLVDNIIANSGKGFFVGLLFAMMADTVDYGEWKTGVRAAGFLFAAANVGIKLGLGVGGAISAWMLAAAGYVPNAEQTAASLAAIRLNYVIVPVVCSVSIMILLLFYRLDKQHPQIVRDLAVRRSAGATI